MYLVRKDGKTTLAKRVCSLSDYRYCDKFSSAANNVRILPLDCQFTAINFFTVPWLFSLAILEVLNFCDDLFSRTKISASRILRI